MVEVEDRIWVVKHKSLRNALYHMARQRWLEAWGRSFNFAIILGGTSAAASALDGGPTTAIAVFIAAIGALQLVYDFSGRAHKHDTLRSRYYHLMADVEECGIPTNKQCLKLEAEISRISADEPPTLRALDAIADNQATAALLGGGPRLEITIWQSVTRQLLVHNSGGFGVRKDWTPGGPTSE